MPPGHPITLLKSNEFNMAAVSVKRSIQPNGIEYFHMTSRRPYWRSKPVLVGVDFDYDFA